MTLPWPPSVNHYWRHPTKGRLAGRHLISEEGKLYRALVQSELLFTRGLKKPLTGRLAIEIKASPPDRRVRDLDNILKSLLDAIVHGGVVEDDSLFDAIAIARLAPEKPGRVDIKIFQLENL
jgi:crossover junction endodeoxyribonuclease RusA